MVKSLKGCRQGSSRCFFLTSDQNRWKFQLSTTVKISGSSELENSLGQQWVHGETVGVRFDSLFEKEIDGAEHRGCCI